MWGREMRAGLAFVLASLLAGGAFREWRRTHETQFADLVDELKAQDRSARDPRAPSSGEAQDSISAGAALGPGAQAPRSHDRSQPLRPARIDLNRATARDLERLPGIGPALAARIVADRERLGPYGTPDALLRVPGIGPRILERVRPYLAAPPGAADSVSPIAN